MQPFHPAIYSIRTRARPTEAGLAREVVQVQAGRDAELGLSRLFGTNPAVFQSTNIQRSLSDVDDTIARPQVAGVEKYPKQYNCRERKIVLGQIPTIGTADTVPPPFCPLLAHPNDAGDVHCAAWFPRPYQAQSGAPSEKDPLLMSQEFSSMWQILLRRYDSLRGGISPSRTRPPFSLMVK
jgi:hypothetical protein